MQNGTRGFTLVEAVIALAVLAVGIVLAGTLLIQAQRMIVQAGVQLRAPGPDPFLERLRAELRGANGIAPGTAPLPGWSRDRLDLVYPDGGRVRWERRGATLVRRQVAPSTGTSGSDGSAGEVGRSRGGHGARGSSAGSLDEGRVVLRGVASWRWLRQGPRLLAVEIGTLESEGRVRALDPVGPIDQGVRPVMRRITVALRGGGLGRGW